MLKTFQIVIYIYWCCILYLVCSHNVLITYRSVDFRKYFAFFWFFGHFFKRRYPLLQMCGSLELSFHCLWNGRRCLFDIIHVIIYYIVFILIFIGVGKLYKRHAAVKKHTKCNKKFQKIGKIVCRNFRRNFRYC